MLDLFGFLAPILGIVMEWIYRVIPNYGPYRGMDDSICMQNDL